MKHMALPIVLAGTIPVLGYVWGQTGHRIVGEIAQRHLSPQAEWRIRDLLDGQSLAEISTWADEIRSDPSSSCSAPFHYTEIPPGTTYFDSPAAGGDVLRAVVYFADILADTTTARPDRQRALKFLVHFVGDMHQPLHIGRGCDRGANDVQVSFFGQQANLHSVWDVNLIDSKNLSFTELTRFIDRPSHAQVMALQQSTPLDWVYDSHARLDQVYTCYAGDRCPCFCGACSGDRSTFGGCTASQCTLKISGDVSLGYQYVYHTWPIVQEQLLEGGIRLAGMLNWIFADRPEPPDPYLAMKRQIEAIPGWDEAFRTCNAGR